MDKVKVTNDIYWVGKVDDRKVPFHRLILEKGTTYNSYLLMTEKPTIIDTVDIAFGREYVENLSKLINVDSIEYIVINHVEPDHAGALPALANKARGAKIVTTALGAEALRDMFRLHSREFIIIKDGDTLDIGGKTLKFFETPYLHTEETMITYSEEDSILFTCDIFSTHIATKELFNDLAREDYLEDFKVYYQLIMHPHRPYVRNMLDKVRDMPISLIAPSHGYILREDPERFVSLYDELSRFVENGENKSVAIVYSTLTGNTTKIAKELAKGLEETGISVKLFNLKDGNLDTVKSEIKKAHGLLVGSSTKYGDMVGNTEEFLKSLAGEDMEDKLAAAFGSYGWSGEGITYVEDYLRKAGFTVVDQSYLVKKIGVDDPIFPLRVKFSRVEGLNRSNDAGRLFGEQIANF